MAACDPVVRERPDECRVVDTASGPCPHCRPDLPAGRPVASRHHRISGGFSSRSPPANGRAFRHRSPFCARGTSMFADNGAFNHVDVSINLTCMICTFLHPGKQRRPEALLPPVEARMDLFPVAVAFGKVTSTAQRSKTVLTALSGRGCVSRSFDPENAIQHRPVLQRGPTSSRALWWE